MALYPVFASVCLPPEALLAAGVRRALSPALELSCEAWASSFTEFSLLILLLILIYCCRSAPGWILDVALARSLGDRCDWLGGRACGLVGA